MSKISHLLVDLDGTLIEGDRIMMRLEFIFYTLLRWKHLGSVPRSFKAFYKMRSAVESQASLTYTNEMRMIHAFAEVFGLSQSEARKVLETTISEVFPRLKRHFFAVPGALDFINWARERYPLILATNPIWPPEYVKFRAEWGGFDMNAFHSFTHAQRMHDCKPNLGYYKELVEQEGLDASQCLLVGNDFRKDLPASQIGIRVFILDQNPGSTVSQCKPIKTPRGSAQAWQGNYAGLKMRLER